MVQEKINTYLRFIESGEILTEYPDAKGRRVVIKVVGLHEPNQEAKAFYQRAADTIAAAGFSLLFERYKESD